MADTLLELAAKCDKAADAYGRVLGMSEGKPVEMGTLALAAGMVLTLHGHLFAEAATALRAISHQEQKP